MNARRLLIAYALVNAMLYSLLLPLWEGFDEPFHFGYVQQLANRQGLPDARAASLSREVGTSILLAPASEAVKQNLREVTDYAQYFSWPATTRTDVRRRLYEIPAESRWQPSRFLNYEAHQPPLAYLLLAGPERTLDRMALPTRVAILRILVAAAGSLLLLSGARCLFQQLGIPDPYRAAGLFCLLSCQMVWATLAHIGNDWLALPLAVWTLVTLGGLGVPAGQARLRANTRPANERNTALAALILALALLTKAYFLAFVPLLIGLCILRKRWRELAIAGVILCGLSGPWYVRNLIRYGALIGTQESRAGVDSPAVLREVPTMNWPAVIKSSVRTSLWTGNNTFSTFSANTLDLVIAAVSLALLLWAASRHLRLEWITVSYCALFLTALAYSATVSHIYTHGAAMGPSPWYAQVLVAPLLGLAMLGPSRWQGVGRFVTALLVLLLGYLLAATYAVKLIPLYGGYPGRASLAAMATLYSRQFATLAANLDTVALAPAPVIFMLAGITIVLVGAQQVLLIRSIFPGKESSLDK